MVSPRGLRGGVRRGGPAARFPLRGMLVACSPTLRALACQNKKSPVYPVLLVHRCWL